ncbi:MAG: hypothetical protein AB7I96_15355 [Candidatus Dadabacteria bacterium]
MKFEDITEGADVEPEIRTQLRVIKGSGSVCRLSADSPESGYFTPQVADVHVNPAGRALPDPERFVPRRTVG